MSPLAAPAATDIGAYVGERISDIEKQSAATGESLRETAKWVISGIAVATAGVIAGTTLSSLGALDYGLRYFAAVGTAAIGYLALAILFALALTVIAPRNHTLQEIADGTRMRKGWQREFEAKLKPLLPDGIDDLKKFTAFADDPKAKDGKPLAGEKLVNLNLTRRWIEAKAKSIERDLQFRRLKFWTFVLTPVIAIAFLAFSSLANPPAEKRVPVMVKTVDVDQDDLPVLRGALASPSCAVPKLPVIVLAESPSGAQDVVTVPAAGCPPVRLRLDHGRLSKAQQ